MATPLDQESASQSNHSDLGSLLDGLLAMHTQVRAICKLAEPLTILQTILEPLPSLNWPTLHINSTVCISG